MVDPHWQGETQLMGFGESDTSGAWIKLQVLPEDLERFRGLKGERFMAVLVQYEEGTDKPKERKVKHSPNAEVRWLGMVCKDPTFRQFLAYMHEPGEEIDEDRAAHWVRKMLEVESRADVPSNPRAMVRFHALRRDYLRWLDENQIDAAGQAL